MNTISDSAWRPSVELAVLPQANSAAAAPAASNGGANGAQDGRAEDEGFKIFGADGFTFLDFLDIINPLHHIPVIGTLYRHFSGDEIDPGSRVFGGTLFFGPIGLVTSLGDVLIRDATGRDVGQHVMAMLDEGEPARPPEVAEAAGPVVVDANAPSLRSSYVVAAAGPADALDPVTAWAMEEVAYRQAMAAKSQAASQVQPEIRDRAAVPMPAVAAAYADSRKALFAAGLAEPAPPAPPLPARLTVDAISAKTAQSIIRHSRQSAAMYAATTYGNGAKHADSDKLDDGAPVVAPPGAVAPLGGWFTDAMLKAQDKYQAGAVNAGNRMPATLDVTH